MNFEPDTQSWNNGMQLSDGSNNVSSSGISLNGSTFYTLPNYQFTSLPTWSMILQYTPLAPPSVNQCILATNYNSGSNTTKVAIIYNEGWYAGYYLNNASVLIGPFNLPIGESSTLILADNGTTLTLYLNKVSKGTVTSSGIQNNTDILIGRCDFASSPPVQGILQSLRLYNHGLTTSEVQNL